MTSHTIPVTKTSLPRLEEYVEMIEKCWENSWLTNNGVMVQKLENDLTDYLEAKHLLLINNGTTALQLAIKAFDLKKEIITTPFSYVATTSSILWEHCKPVFVDISPEDLCIDVKKIEEKITPNTEAILAVHVYGNPCDVETIDVLAKRYNLKIIYDAAHAFGVKYKGQYLTNYGDASILSFHATKLFHSIEGGAVITNSKEYAENINLRRSFGHIQDDHYVLGINGKMNEFQAAMGLCNLPRMETILEGRKKVFNIYNNAFKNTENIKLIIPRSETEINFSYYPIILESEKVCLHLLSKLKDVSIATRRYFYPSLNTLPYLEYQPCPISEDISCRILCLPLFSELSVENANDVVEKVNEVLKSL